MVLAWFPITSSWNPACYIRGLIHEIGRGVPNALRLCRLKLEGLLIIKVGQYRNVGKRRDDHVKCILWTCFTSEKVLLLGRHLCRRSFKGRTIAENPFMNRLLYPVKPIKLRTVFNSQFRPKPCLWSAIFYFLNTCSTVWP